MNRTLSRNTGWLATLLALVAVSLTLAFQHSSAQVARAGVLRSVAAAGPAAVGAQGGTGSGSFVMDGDWFYILRGNRFYKVQKSTMSVFQTLDLN